MNIGLPGAGIGGLYYLTCTAIMPIRELLLTLRNPEHKFRSRLVATQFSIATGIVAGLYLVFQLAESLVELGLPVTTPESADTALFYSLLPLALSFSLLALILLVVELCAFITKRKEIAQRKIEIESAQ